MMPLRGVTDMEGIARDIGNLPGGQTTVLDLKRESDNLYRTYRDEALRHSLLGAVAIAALLLVSLRSLRRVYDVLARLSRQWRSLLQSWRLRGETHDISSHRDAIGCCGGSNYSLFFERQGPSDNDTERVMVSLVFAVISTMIGFGLLAFSSVPVLHAIGSTVAIGAVLALVFAAVLGGGERVGIRKYVMFR
jgi:predicted exporter